MISAVKCAAKLGGICADRCPASKCTGAHINVVSQYHCFAAVVVCLTSISADSIHFVPKICQLLQSADIYGIHRRCAAAVFDMVWDFRRLIAAHIFEGRQLVISCVFPCTGVAEYAAPSHAKAVCTVIA